MVYKLRITLPAEQDFDDILQRTLDKWGADQYFKYEGQILGGMAAITEDPERLLSKVRDDLYKGARLYPVGKHYLLYSMTSDTVVLERILYQGMDLPRHLKDLADKRKSFE